MPRRLAEAPERERGTKPGYNYPPKPSSKKIGLWQKLSFEKLGLWQKLSFKKIGFLLNLPFGG
jgi:hypothetical protein